MLMDTDTVMDMDTVMAVMDTTILTKIAVAILTLILVDKHVAPRLLKNYLKSLYFCSDIWALCFAILQYSTSTFCKNPDKSGRIYSQGTIAFILLNSMDSSNKKQAPRRNETML